MDSLLLPGNCCGPDDYEIVNHQPSGYHDNNYIIFICYVMYTVMLYFIRVVKV